MNWLAFIVAELPLKFPLRQPDYILIYYYLSLNTSNIKKKKPGQKERDVSNSSDKHHK